MNHVYRVVFNRALGLLQAVSELTHRAGKTTSRTRSPLITLTLSSPHRLSTAKPLEKKALAFSCSLLLSVSPLAQSADFISGGGDGGGSKTDASSQIALGGTGGTVGGGGGAASGGGNGGHGARPGAPATAGATGTGTAAPGQPGGNDLSSAGGGGSQSNIGGGNGAQGLVTGELLYINQTALAGGNGANSQGAGGGGGGGALVLTATGAQLINQTDGTITGGTGGQSSGVGGGGGGAGVALMNNGSIFNHGSITGGSGGASARNAGANGGTGVFLVNGGSLDNSNTGQITGGNGSANGTAHAGVLSNRGSILNGGVITGGSSTGAGGFGGAGIMANGGYIINTVNASIRGGSGGTGATGGAAIALLNDGSATIDNQGTLIGGNNGGVGVSLGSNNNTLLNSGSIQGSTSASAVTVSGNSNNITNSGSIMGGVRATGITVSGNSNSITNSSTIQGGVNGSGIVLSGDGNSVTNHGSIQGGISGSGIAVSGNGNRITTSGRITAGIVAANAIALNGNNNTLELQAGFSFNGGITATGTNNQLILGGNTDASLSIFPISGFSGYEKIGSSTWTLTGNSSNIMPWTLTEGTLSVSSAGALGGVNSLLTFNGGTLQTTDTFSSARLVTITENGGVINTGGNLTLNGVLSGIGSLFKTGTQTLFLTGVNSYQGGTTISEGTLSISADANLGAKAGAVTLDGGTLQLTGEMNSSRNLNLTANGGTLDTQADVTFSGTMSGPGTLTKNGTGSLLLTGSNSQVRAMMISAGELVFDQLGRFTVTGDYITEAGATTTIAGETSQLSVAGTFTQAMGATLNLIVGSSPDIQADNAVLDGNVVITGFDIGPTPVKASQIEGKSYTLISTENGITGNFANNPLSATGLDYLLHGGAITRDGRDYTVGFKLAWTDSALSDTSNQFTLYKNTAFDVDVSLGDHPVGSPTNPTGAGTTLIKAGDGLLVLSANNTYSGGTQLNGGTLSVSSDTNLGAASGALTFDGGTLLNSASFDTARLVNLLGQGTLNVVENTVLGLTGTLSGAGELVKSGSGTLNLLGDGSGFTGTADIQSGLIRVNSAFGGTMNVLQGATLAGTGSMNTLNVLNGGIVKPGNSIGTLSVTEDARFAAGAFYQVELNDQGQSDLLDIGGTLALSGGTVQVLAETGLYARTYQYTIATANDGVSGQFDSVVDDLAFYDASLNYDTHNVYLNLARNQVQFADYAGNRNQRNMANVLVDLNHNGRLYQALESLPDNPAVIQSAYAQLSGELHPAAQTALIEDSRVLREAANTRLRSVQEGIGSRNLVEAEDGALWAYSFGSWGHSRSGDNNARLQRDLSGLLIGSDISVGDWQVGTMTGYSRSSFTQNSLASQGHSDNYHLGFYAGKEWEQLALRSAAIYSWHSLDTQRNIAFPSYSDSLHSRYRGRTAQLFSELGYRLELGASTLEPFANLSYLRLQTNAFSENGGEAALQGAGSRSEVTFSTLGLHASTRLVVADHDVKATGSIGWRHAAGTTTPDRELNFLSGSRSFGISSAPVARNAAVLDVGTALSLAPQASLNLGYQGQLSSNAQDHSVQGSFTWRF